MTKARDLSKLLSTANGKIAGANLDVSFENISDTGTAGTKVASGTTGQRGSTAGQIRFNTTTGLAEYYDGANYKSIDAPPTVTAVSPLEVESDVGGNVTFTITGTNFGVGAVAKFIGSDATEITASTTTVTNSTTISAVIARSSFVNAKEPYDVKVINGSGLSATLDNQISVDVSPVWNTASGTLATIYDNMTGTHATVSATDADGDTVSYSETGGTVLTTAGLTLNSSTGVISGNPTDVGSATTYSFNLRASAGGINVDRAFNIIVNTALGTATNPATSSAQLYNAGYTTNGNYYYNNAFTANSVRQCYTRFNTRDGVHWHRWSPYHFGYAITKHGGGAGNTTISDTSTPDLTSSTLSSSVRDFTYTTSSSGAGASAIWRVGLTISSFNGLYFGTELYEDSNGDSSGGTSGNKGGIGIEYQSTDGGTGNWSAFQPNGDANYSSDLTIIQSGYDTTRSNNNARNFAAIKFTQNGNSTNFSRSDNAIGGIFGVTTSESGLWSRYSDINNTGFLANNSGSEVYTGTITSTDYFALRLAGWSDTSNILRFRGIFWIGSK
jgi:hypothetical protein